MKLSRVTLAAALMCAASTTAFAQTATQTLNLTISAISVMAVAPGTPTLAVNAAVAGAANATVATASSTYDITNNQTARKITMGIDSNVPAGMTLTGTLTAVGSGTSAGIKTLSTVASDMVTGMGPVATSGVAINYSLTVAATTAPVSISRTVTFTIL